MIVTIVLDYNSLFFVKILLFLDWSYVTFEYVTDGMDVVDALCKNAESIDSNNSIPPEEQPIIKSNRIVEN